MAAASPRHILREAADDLVREAMQRGSRDVGRGGRMLELKPERFDICWDPTVPDQVSLCGKPLRSPTAPARSTGRPRRRCWSRTCTWRRARRYAERGTLLPPYDTRETLARLAEVDRPLRARHASSRSATACTMRGAAERIGADDLEISAALQEDREWIWIAGNHDPEIAERARRARLLDDLEVAGSRCATSRRPAASRTRSPATCTPPPSSPCTATTIRRPCFVGNGRRLVMPAFGAFTGGLNVLDDAFEPLFGNGGMARVDARPGRALPRRDAAAERGLTY